MVESVSYEEYSGGVAKNEAADIEAVDNEADKEAENAANSRNMEEFASNFDGFVTHRAPKSQQFFETKVRASDSLLLQ